MNVVKTSSVSEERIHWLRSLSPVVLSRRHWRCADAVSERYDEITARTELARSRRAPTNRLLLVTRTRRRLNASNIAHCDHYNVLTQNGPNRQDAYTTLVVIKTKVRFVQKAVGVLLLPFPPFPSPLSFPLPFRLPRQKFSVTSVGVIFNQWGLNPQSSRQIERWIKLTCFVKLFQQSGTSMYPTFWAIAHILRALRTSVAVCRDETQPRCLGGNHVSGRTNQWMSEIAYFSAEK